MCPSESSVPTAEVNAPSIQLVRTVVEKHFPSLWPAAEAGLSTCVTLLLEDNSNPVTLILCGASGSGKSTVTNMFDGIAIQGKPFTYRSDKFTTASFVSHSVQATQEQLMDVDLLPRIKDKVLLTPELSPIFRGKPDELVGRFSILTRVLDGQGLMTDSGAHGQRGYKGPLIFAWIGATTPLDATVWEIMATLGSRLFFLMLDTEERTTIDDLVASLSREVPHADGVEECKKVIEQFLNGLFTRHSGVGGLRWNRRNNNRSVLEVIARFAGLMAIMRTPFNQECKPMPESPHRANAVLYNLARGHALIHDRLDLTTDDLPLVAEVASSSIPHNRRAILLAMAQNNGNPLSVQQVQTALGVSRHTAEKAMEEMHWLGIAVFGKPGNGLPSTLTLKAEWSWFMKDEGLAYLQGTTWQNSGDRQTAGSLQPCLSLDRERKIVDGGGSLPTSLNLPGTSTP